MNTAKNDEGTASGGAASWEGQDARSTTLHRFEVRVLGETKVSAPVYANNRQRVPIEVIIEVRNADGDLITIPESGLRDMRLIDYETGGNLSGWYPEKNEYVYEWTPVRENGADVPGRASGDDAPAPTAQSIMRYISTGEDLKWVAAEFSLFGTTYRTNTPGAQPGSGEFDSWIKVIGVEPVDHPFSEFVLDGPIHYGSEAGRYDIALYYVRFNDPQYRILGAAREGGLLDQRHFSRSAGGWSDKSHVAYDVGGQRTVEHAPGVSLIVNSRPGQATVARIGTNIAALDRDETPLVHYYDQHGNKGSVRFQNSDDGATLYIEDPNAPPVWKWLTLDDFRVTCQQAEKVTAPVYANGRQQVQLQVYIRARNEQGEAVDLTEEELNSIELIAYEQGHLLPFQTVHDTRFEYNHAVQREEGGAVIGEDAPDSDGVTPASQGVWRYFTTEVPGQVTKIAARITAPNGAIFTTNAKEPSPGKFDSWVNVRGIQSPVHAWNSFVMAGPINHGNNDRQDVDIYFIRFAEDALRIVASIHHGFEPEEHHYSWEKGGWWAKVHIAFSPGPARTFRWPRDGGTHSMYIPINERAGQACALRISMNLQPPESIAGSLRVTYIDQFGCGGDTRIQPTSDGNGMHLKDPNASVLFDG